MTDREKAIKWYFSLPYEVHWCIRLNSRGNKTHLEYKFFDDLINIWQQLQTK